MIVYPRPQVLDAATAQPLVGLRRRPVTIVAVGTTTPVEVFEYVAGAVPEEWPPVPGSVLTVGELLALPTFATADDVLMVEALAEGGVRALLWSPTGLMGAAQAAAAASAAAADDAAVSAARSMQLRGNAAAGVAFWGSFTSGAAPGVADGVQVGDLGVLLP